MQKTDKTNCNRVTWYIGICGIMAMSLLYGLALWSHVCVCGGGGEAFNPMVS
jgi:hypothetical protein